MFKIESSNIPTTKSQLADYNSRQQELLANQPPYARVFSDPRMWDEVEAEVARIQSRSKHLVVIGMGGSSLGAKALTALQDSPEQPTKVHFIDTIDPDHIHAVLNHVDFESTHWFAASKSGSTLETLSILEYCVRLCQSKKVYDPKAYTVITTNQDSPIRQWAESQHIQILEIPADLSGRFSVFSPIGLIPVGCSGIPLSQVRAGLTHVCESPDVVAQLFALLVQAHNQTDSKLLIQWIYADRLMQFGYWFQQLWAESLGKAKTRTGSQAPFVAEPYCLRGVSDHHSVLQQIAEGPTDKIICFLEVDQQTSLPVIEQDSLFQPAVLPRLEQINDLRKIQAAANRASLEEKGLSCFRIQLESLSAKSLTELMLSFEFAVQLFSDEINVDTFNQPGVEDYKIRTKAILKDQA